MEIEQNWQNYRSMIKEKVAIFSVNLTLFQCYQKTQATHRTILQFSLPLWRKKRIATNRRLSILAQRNAAPFGPLLSAQPQSVYALYAFR